MVNFFRKVTDYVSNQIQLPSFKNRSNPRQSTIDDIVGSLTATATAVTAAVAGTGVFAYAAYAAATTVGAIGAAATAVVAVPAIMVGTLVAAPYLFNQDYRMNANHLIGQLVTNTVETGISAIRTGAGMVQDAMEAGYLATTWTARQAATGLLHGAEYLADAFSGNGQIPGYNAHVGNHFTQNWNSINAMYKTEFSELNTRFNNRFDNNPFIAGHGNDANRPMGLIDNFRDIMNNLTNNLSRTIGSYFGSLRGQNRQWFNHALYNPGQRLAFA